MKGVEGRRGHGRGWREEREGGSDVITFLIKNVEKI